MIQDLQDYLDDRGIRYFDADEVTKVHAGFPPPELWPNIIPTLKVLDLVRERLDTPFTVTSGYRSPEYNRRVGGAPSSLHLRFSAVDVWVRTHSPHQIKQALVDTLGARFVDALLGVGVYPGNGFIHVDTRGLTQDMVGAAWEIP